MEVCRHVTSAHGDRDVRRGIPSSYDALEGFWGVFHEGQSRGYGLTGVCLSGEFLLVNGDFVYRGWGGGGDDLRIISDTYKHTYKHI